MAVKSASASSSNSTGAHRLSPKAAQLHQTVKESLNAKDRADFVRILDYYQRTNNIQRFVESLSAICTTPQQREEIYPLLRTFIPRKHRDRFDYECSRPNTSHGRSYSKLELERARYYNTVRSLPAEYGYGTPSVDSGFGTARRSPRKYETRTKERRPCAEKLIVLERDKVGGEPFGFSIRGGAEHNIALFVSSVDEGSIAERAGLSLGDQLITANQIDFCGLFHKDAIEIIKDASSLHLMVKCIGKIPGTYKSSSSYRWIDPLGNQVSPPTEYVKANLLKNEEEFSEMTTEADDERKVNLFVADGAELGLTIRGGSEHGLGIFIASVDINSGAQRAGVQVGDQILDVNGNNFMDINHEQAVRTLKSSQHLVITLKDLGILPHGKKVREERKWIKENKDSPRCSSSDSEKRRGKAKKVPSFHDPLGSSLLTHHSVTDHSEDMLKIKARKVLSNNELHAFMFYLEEYRIAHLSLLSLLSALTDLLKTPDKITLIQELRLAILPRDLSKFDDWLEERSDELIQTVSLRQERNGDEQSLCSYRSSNSSNSWFRFLEDDDRQRLKSPSREKFHRLPDRPWDTASVGSRSSRARRAMPFDDFPQPPVFEDTPPTKKSPPELPPVNRATVSPSDITFDESSPERFINDVGNRFDTSNPQDTSPPNFHGVLTNGDAEDVLYEDVDVNYKNRLSPNHTLTQNRLSTNGIPTKNSLTTLETSSQNRFLTNETTNQNRLSTLDMFTRLNISDDEDNEDGYTAVKPSRNSLPPNFDTNDFKKTGRDNVLTDRNPSENFPIYAKVDKSKKRNKTKNDAAKQPLFDENDIPSPIIDGLFGLPETDHNRDEFSGELRNDKGINQNYSEIEQSKPATSLQQQITGELSKRSANAKSNGHMEFRYSSGADGNRKLVEEQQKPRTAGSTKRIKKSKKSKTNIAQMGQAFDTDDQPFVVELDKHCPNLGLAITGGTDTESKDIRIKSVQDANTVAGSCPLLKPGQIILGVDEKSLRNVTSGIAAMAIRQAFHSDKTVLKLILTSDF